MFLQQKFVVPLNRDSEYLFYNLRMIIDAKVLTEPRAWEITKINRISNYGLVLVTLAQDKFDQHKDYIEFDSKGNIVGMWANYMSSPIEPDENTTIKHREDYSSISFSGLKKEIKIGGNYKKFTVNFFDKNGEEIPYENGIWSYTLKENETATEFDATEYVTILTSAESADVNENQIKLKFVDDDTFIGYILTIKYDTEDIHSEVEMALVSL